MYICANIYEYICEYISQCIYLRIYIYVYLFAYTHVYIDIHIYICIEVNIYTYIHTYIYIYIYIYIYKWIHIYIKCYFPLYNNRYSLRRTLYFLALCLTRLSSTCQQSIPNLTSLFVHCLSLLFFFLFRGTTEHPKNHWFPTASVSSDVRGVCRRGPKSISWNNIKAWSEPLQKLLALSLANLMNV